ncbi:MAG TPA: carboxypeptidase regulatory-like domain-containing protein, partial [Acidobacteriaceae bacterium]|nr:carboxypeptidase regulatory-like domain-containing protein [Acidobacteriaceae bacterium]
FVSSCFGQGFGTIVGTVTDPSGAVIAGASVRVTDPATGITREEKTNDQGYYVLPSLRPATYNLSFSASGFASTTQNGITLLADQTATVNAALKIGQAAETVLVNAQTPQVNTTTATMSEVVEQRRVVELPLNGRNPASLLLVVAGATPAPGNGVDQGNSKTFPAAVTVSTNGSRQNQVSFRLDGANNNDLYTNANQPFPFPDALQEFSVQTSNYGARYGGNAGGVVNIVTKSGTNQFHGDAFDFVRNPIFNARNFFATTADVVKRNQFGGTLGGPVSIPKLYSGKDKTFFFFGYQGTKIRNIGNISSSFVPTAAERTGDFSALLSATNSANPFQKKIQINDRNGNPIAGNKLLPSQMDPAALNFLKYLPAGTGDGRIFYSQPIVQDFTEYTARGDHSFSERDRLSVRYFYDSFDNQGYLDKTNYLSYQNYSTIIAQNALIGETHLFGAGAVNEFRASFSRETSNRGPAEGSISLADLGVNIYTPPTAKTIEGINVSGYFNPGQTDPAAFIRNQYNLSDDFSLVHGKHNLSFGGSAIRAQVLLRNQFRTSGQYTFTSDVTNDALASFMQGYVRTFTQGFGEFKDNLVNTYSLYIQDDYHASRRLTFNLGLRYDPFFPWVEQKNRVEQFSTVDYAAGVRSKVYVNAPPGLLFPGDPGVPKAGIGSSLSNFAPRFGFAYDVTGDGKTSLRGGFGVFYDSVQNGIINNRFVDVTPFSPQFSLTTPPGTFSNPYVGFSNPYPAPFPPPANSPFPGPVLAVTYDPSHGHKQLTPTMYNWNLSFEHQFAGNWLVRAAYVASHASHLLETMELNPANYIPGSKLSTDARRAFQPYGSISQATQDINSSFNSAQLTVQKSMSHGLTILANYTWSKSLYDLPTVQYITTAGAGSPSPIPWNFPGRHQLDYGPSEFDHTHRFVVSYIWSFPAFAGRSPFVRYTIGGWQWSGIVTAQTGTPFTVYAGKDQSQTGLGTDRANFVSSDVYGGNACGTTKTICVNYLNPAAFAVPAIGTFGNVGKNSLRGPNLFTWDTGLFKEFPIASERVRLQFRAEYFNVLNRANFDYPASGNTPSYSSSGFGTITKAEDPRIGQLALKLLF